MKRTKLLFLNTVLLRPPKYKIAKFGQYYSGSIITPFHNRKYFSLKHIFGFRFHSFKYYRGNSLLRNMHLITLSIIISLKIYFKGEKFDVIISPNPFITGFIAFFLSAITRAKVIVEVNGNFESAFKFGWGGEIKPGFMDRLKGCVSKLIISLVLKRADMVKLLYLKQLEPLKIKGKINTTAFADFVTINKFIKADKNDEKYILLLGYPWYLKGVDVLINAFNKISWKFPDYRLKIVGWCPHGRDFYEELSKDNPKIDLCDPVSYDEVVILMSRCSLYVLASRTEAMGRVLLEAMASKKPIIASNVGGVPEVIKDGYNGLLFEKENVDDLADKINLLLSNRDLTTKLAQNGFEYVQKYMSEDSYIENYRQMIKEVLK